MSPPAGGRARRSAATTPLTGTYAIDPTHSRIGFVARPAMVTKVRGSFNEFEGTGHLDADDPTRSQLQLTIQAASIDTRNADRDGHLRSNEFFDMEQHPEITFVSTGSSRSTPRATGSPVTSRSRASPGPSPSTSSTPAPPPTPSETSGSAYPLLEQAWRPHP